MGAGGGDDGLEEGAGSQSEVLATDEVEVEGVEDSELTENVNLKVIWRDEDASRGFSGRLGRYNLQSRQREGTSCSA
jgi:hypothetical protein